MATWSTNWKRGKRRTQRFELRRVVWSIADQLGITSPSERQYVVCSTDAPGGNGRPTCTERARA